MPACHWQWGLCFQASGDRKRRCKPPAVSPPKFTVVLIHQTWIPSYSPNNIWITEWRWCQILGYFELYPTNTPRFSRVIEHVKISDQLKGFYLTIFTLHPLSQTIKPVHRCAPFSYVNILHSPDTLPKTVCFAFQVLVNTFWSLLLRFSLAPQMFTGNTVAVLSHLQSKGMCIQPYLRHFSTTWVRLKMVWLNITGMATLVFHYAMVTLQCWWGLYNEAVDNFHSTVSM